MIVSHYIRGGELTSVLEPEERRCDRGVFGRNEDGGGRGFGTLDGRDVRVSTEMSSIRGAGDGEDEETTIDVNRLQSRFKDWEGASHLHCLHLYLCCLLLSSCANAGEGKRKPTGKP